MDVAGEFLIGPLIEPDDRIEEFRNSLAVAAHRGTHRDAQQAAQLFRVQFVPLMLKLIVHVQGHDGLEVHVDDLRRQIQVALDVGGIDHIDHHVRHGVDEVLPNIQFLRGIR